MLKFEKAFFLAVLMFGLAGGASAADEPLKVTLALSHPTVGPSEETYIYVVPKHLGYFRKEGLDVTLQTTASVVVTAQLVESGSAEFASTTADIILPMREQGGDLVAVMGLKRNPGHTIAVAEDSPVKTLQDLKGKSIGSTQWAGMGGVVLIASLSDLGIEPGTYTKITMAPGPTAAVALRNGQVDALAFWDAIYAALENTGLKMRYLELPLDLKFASYSLTTSDRFMAAHPKAVEGYCRAASEGIEFTRTNPVAAVRILLEEFPALRPASLDLNTAVANDTHILEAYLANAMQGIPLHGKTGEIDPAIWSFAADFHRKNGALKGTVPAEQGYTNRFIEACNDFDRSAIDAAAQDYGK